MSDKSKTNVLLLIAAVFSTGLLLFCLLPAQVLPVDGPHTRESSYSEKSNIPEFYKMLSKEKGNFSIIEYPAIVQDRYNPVPYYQSFHEKNVLRGYFFSHALKKQFKIKNMLNNKIWPLETIFSRLEIKKTYFTFIMNFFPDIIDLYDINSIRNSGAKYIILHKQMKDEVLAVTEDPQFKEKFANVTQNIWEQFYRSSLHFKGYYQRYMGDPVFEDKLLVVFKIN